MVAIIKTGHSVRRLLNYNENKVKEGVASCIGAENFPVDHDQMSFAFKDRFFKNQLSLNEKVTRNSVHISLNFHESESGLSEEKLLEIARTYMAGIGFGSQPYLVYQHRDAGHPHIHIVSIKVRADGSRIDMQNIGRNESETTRLSIEKTFGLVPASSSQPHLTNRILPVTAEKIEYGKSQTRRAIQNVLDKVVSQYKFCSLPELNAILKQYNILADRGSEDSRIYKKKGLVYRIIGPDGNRVGVPIKASLFYNKPTLNFLESRYVSNAIKRAPYKTRIKNEIDKALLKGGVDLTQLSNHLEKKGIIMIQRKNDEGILYGITYVDYKTKCVFNGSSLGKQYSAKMIQERCFEASERMIEAGPKITNSHMNSGDRPEDHSDLQLPAANELMNELLRVETGQDHLPYELRKTRKRRKKKRPS